MARVGDLTADRPGLLSQKAGRERTTHSLSEFAHSDMEVTWNGSMFTILVAFDKNDKGQYVGILRATNMRNWL
jgi:hypothetical protein